MELVNAWFPTGKFRKVDIPLWTDSTYENELMAAFSLTVNALRKSEMEYHGKFGYNLGQIHKIAITRRIDICYTVCHLVTQIVAPTLTSFQGIKLCIQYLASHLHKPIFYPSNYYVGSNVIRLTWSGTQVEEYSTQNCLECYQDADHARTLIMR